MGRGCRVGAARLGAVVWGGKENFVLQICSRPKNFRRSCGARLVALLATLAALGRAADRPRPRRGASARPSACARRACTARALAGSTRAPSSHTHRRPRKLRLRCAATDQQRQAPPTGLEDRRARRASIAPRTDTFAVLCITAEERAVRALASVAGRGRWAIVCARRNGEQRRTRRAARASGPVRSAGIVNHINKMNTKGTAC